MKAIDRVNRDAGRKIVLAFVGVSVIMLLVWSVLNAVVAYAIAGMNRSETHGELMADAQRAVGLLEAAGLQRGGSLGQAGAGGESADRMERLLELYAQDKEIALALQSGSGEWRTYGAGPADWLEREGAGQVAEQASQGGNGAAVTAYYSYRWANPFASRDATLIAAIEGGDGALYRIAVGKKLPALNAHYWHAVAPQLLFIALLAIISLIISPWRRQMMMLNMLMDSMRRIASGDFGVKFPIERRMGEMGVIAEGLNDMVSDLKELEQTRQRFISDVSHELQSPLTSIAGFARALRSESLSPEARHDYLNRIETESMRLSKLSDSLLKLTMLEARREPVEPHPISLDMQLKHTALALEPLWLAKGIELDIELEPLTVIGDEDALRQVWTNLLHNAIKFTPEGGTIRLQLAREKEHAHVVVADSGIGIAAEDLPHVFERFYKADKARSSAQGGSGLGLSIAFTIVQQHGGAMTVDSKQGEGAAFGVKLPMKPGNEQAKA